MPVKIESYFKDNNFELRRELVKLHINDYERIRREKNRGKDLQRMLELMSVMKTDYQNPREYRFKDVELLEYQNNNIEEQKEIINDFIMRLNFS